MATEEKLFERLAAVLAERRPVALATVIAARGSAPRRVGARMLIHPDGRGEGGTIGGGRFESLVVEAAVEMLRARRREGIVREFPLHEQAADSFGAVCGGTVTVFLEPLGLAPRVVCVGAGHCSRALARAVVALGWEMEVVEDRAAELGAEHFPGVRRVHVVEDVAATMDTLALDRATAVCLLNRNHLLDRDCLGRLLARLRRERDAGGGDAGDAPFYLGMIGSRRKVERVFAELGESGLATAADRALVHAPIGLEIGADSPEEIAVSILAEIIGTWRGAAAMPVAAPPLPGPPSA